MDGQTIKYNMEINALKLNAASLKREFKWFSAVLELRFKSYFDKNKVVDTSIYDLPVPDLSIDPSLYAHVALHYNMNPQERLVLLLALAPHIMPQVLDKFFTKNNFYDRRYSEFGGILTGQFSGFIPTIETALFLLSENNLERRFSLEKIFEQSHFFYCHNMIRLEESKEKYDPDTSSALIVTKEYLNYFTSGDNFKPAYSSNFPAKLITTLLNWEDLVLEDHIMAEVEEIIAWIDYHHIILKDWGLGHIIKPGYRALFYGPPGTGKTLTASLLGKGTGLKVYRIDLSMIVSKYIGETEKNLANIFNQAEHKQWILFFDEADALFGARTATKDAKDRYANQEIAYLLQRIEDFPGVVILATNLKGNIDQAFSRRFQSMVYFPLPNADQRFRLWKNAFPDDSKLADDVELRQIAEEYELSGGAMTNILRYCTLNALRHNHNVIYLNDILHGIRREFRKEGKTI